MIKVLIVDDSSIVRTVLKRELEAMPNVEVVGIAPDPYIAREMIAKYRPDVMTLDIEMPRMDGITFLKKVMKHFPIPTIVVSSLTRQNSAMAIEALNAGAFDVVAKPGEAYSIDDVIPQLKDLVHAAAITDVGRLQATCLSQKSSVYRSLESLHTTTNKIIAIGSSTGGTRALESILPTLPADSPGVVIVQHMPQGFTASFAERLNSLCRIRVKEAEDGDAVLPGIALVAPGNFHMLLERDGARYIVRIKGGPPVYHQRPCVEILFNSVARFAGKNSVGILLTGMGADGAKGLLNMKKMGARTFAQDEKTSVVWGMPGEAVKIGAAEFILPLNSILPKVAVLLRQNN